MCLARFLTCSFRICSYRIKLWDSVWSEVHRCLDYLYQIARKSGKNSGGTCRRLKHPKIWYHQNNPVGFFFFPPLCSLWSLGYSSLSSDQTWGSRILTTGPPGNFPFVLFYNIYLFGCTMSSLRRLGSLLSACKI